MKRLIVMVTGLLLGSTAVMAQGEKKTTSVTPTALPGEETLTPRERAERDFLMPARRKQDAVLKAAAREEAAAHADTEVSAYHAEAVPEPKAPEAAPKASTPVAAPRHVASHSRHRSTSSKKKVVHKSSSGSKRKTATKSSRSRR